MAIKPNWVWWATDTSHIMSDWPLIGQLPSMVSCCSGKCPHEKDHSVLVNIWTTCHLGISGKTCQTCDVFMFYCWSVAVLYVRLKWQGSNTFVKHTWTLYQWWCCNSFKYKSPILLILFLHNIWHMWLEIRFILLPSS